MFYNKFIKAISNNNTTNPFRNTPELMIENLLKENEDLKKDLNKSRNSNIIGTVKEITFKLIVLIVIIFGIGLIGYGIHRLTIDDTSGQHQRNVSQWTAREYMRSHSNQNLQYNIYCAPQIMNDSNNQYKTCNTRFLICDVSHLNSQGNLVRDNSLCCDSDEHNSNDGCYQN